MKANLDPVATPAEALRPSLQKQLRLISTKCSQCQCCVAECRFLKNYGDPKQLADSYDPNDDFSLRMPFECSLCGLCTAVCPDGVDPVQMFLEMRRETCDRGEGNYPEHKGLEGYEKKGSSQRFSWYALPENCDTIFFPGCALTGSRPEQTMQAFEVLQRNVPSVGMVLDCCSKPSHDLGREESFQAMFGEMKQFLVENGIRRVLVACPNCDKVFSDYAPELETGSIYEYLDAGDIPDSALVSGTVNVHDPCVSRFSDSVHDAVRSLVKKKGLSIVESEHSRRTTLCCGAGGAVGCVAPVLARGWTEKRTREVSDSRTVTYCASCANSLGAQGPVSHILDLIFDPRAALDGKAKVSRAPLTYLNRLKVKKQLKNNLEAAVTRERTFIYGEEAKGGMLKKLALLTVIIAIIVAFQSAVVGGS